MTDSHKTGEGQSMPPRLVGSVAGDIVLEGVRVNNLRGVNVQIQRNALTVICGVSGSGKSSLAFDTLYAEGQRRYVETFSPYARQFLDQVERPDVDRIDGIPPAIAIRQNVSGQSARSTVGTRTEILDYLRVLFAKIGEVTCDGCGVAAESMTADSAAELIIDRWSNRRGILTVSAAQAASADSWLQLGFVRGIHAESVQPLQDLAATEVMPTDIVTDRIRITEDGRVRLSESVDQAFSIGGGHCTLLIEVLPGDATLSGSQRTVDGKLWHAVPLARGLICLQCGRTFADVTAESLNFQSAIGACVTCEGSGQISGMSFDKVVPDRRLSLAEGAIQPWTTPAYRHELNELLAIAPEYGIPVDRPFAELKESQRRLIYGGVPEHSFGGLAGFHRWLVRNRYKQGVSVFLNRWRSWLPCPDCHGRRLAGTGATVKIGGCSLPDVCSLEVIQLQLWLKQAFAGQPTSSTQALLPVHRQLQSRLNFLQNCGLDYLSLERSMKTLSGGEAQRVVLTAALGSGLINTLYVLDEPTSGLHAADTAKVIDAARKLQQAGNTVVVVEHDPEFIAAADQVIEIGPLAGDAGGEVVFQGTFSELRNANTATGAFFNQASSTAVADAARKRLPQRSPRQWITFENVSCHNVCELSGKLPLDCICAITGVSGSGKSSLIVDTLYPAICRELGQNSSSDALGTVGCISGIECISKILLLDQSPLPRSRRSIPATVIGAFDEIRKVMADTHEAKKRNYTPGMFSFNSAKGGRCPECEGYGIVTIEMQFLADIQTTCEACSGRRFRPDVLEVRYRDRSIHDVLKMTIEDAFTFFGGHRKIQQRLNALRQAGLAYIRLGQPVSTLSGGESQRLKIATLLAGIPLEDGIPTGHRQNNRAGGTLFVLDEPSTGLHMRDIGALMQCLNHLVEIGHSVIVIEHDQAVISHADYVLEMGPGAGRHGGRIVTAGPPSQ